MRHESWVATAFAAGLLLGAAAIALQQPDVLCFEDHVVQASRCIPLR